MKTVQEVLSAFETAGLKTVASPLDTAMARNVIQLRKPA
jgi:hypothetical protein